MEQPTKTPKATSKIPLHRWLLIGIITLTLTLFAVQRFNTLKPQLDIKNTGGTPVTVQHRGDSFVVQSGQTWHIRFRPGETMILHAGETVAAPSRTVILERRGLQSGMLSRVPVEVIVEGITNILFKYSETN